MSKDIVSSLKVPLKGYKKTVLDYSKKKIAGKESISKLKMKTSFVPGEQNPVPHKKMMENFKKNMKKAFFKK